MGYTNNHYVPQWYQQQFFPPDTSQKELFYLDLKIDQQNHKPLRKLPTKHCFSIDNLYTTKYQNLTSTEIEEKFFGRIDLDGSNAHQYWVDFNHPSASQEHFFALMNFMSTQKLRTPKGLLYLARALRTKNENLILIEMQKYQNFFCACWADAIWSIADATNCETKFIISDHPVTVYNPHCPPTSSHCYGDNDPDIRYSGTHTIYPLSLNKILILTNMYRVRNFYRSPLAKIPNLKMHRDTLFNFMEIQCNRMLNDYEVNEINYVIKRRAKKYIAAGKKEWLYPEETLSTLNWKSLGNGYLFMPDPREVTFSEEILTRFSNGRVFAIDGYGRTPIDPGYLKKKGREREDASFQTFQCEFARVFGPKHRGVSYNHMQTHFEDSPGYHDFLVQSEQIYKDRFRSLKQKR